MGPGCLSAQPYSHHPLRHQAPAVLTWTPRASRGSLGQGEAPPGWPGDAPTQMTAKADIPAPCRV